MVYDIRFVIAAVLKEACMLSTYTQALGLMQLESLIA